MKSKDLTTVGKSIMKNKTIFNAIIETFEMYDSQVILFIVNTVLKIQWLRDYVMYQVTDHVPKVRCLVFIMTTIIMLK